MKKSFIYLLVLALMLSSFVFSAGAQSNIVYTGANSSTADGSYDHPYPELTDALSAVSEGGTICIKSGSYSFINDVGNDEPFVINKSVTITTEPGSAEKGAIAARCAGILLMADVTFDNIDLGFANPYHNALMANGYNLTLNNVGRYSGHFSIHLFAGGLNNYESGSNAQLTISGAGTNLGCIYAGGLNAGYNGNVSITINGANGMKTGNLYSCGATEAYVDRDNWFGITDPDAPFANPVFYPVTGNVLWTLDNISGKTLDGSGCERADVTCRAGDTGSMVNLTFNAIDSLTADAGTVEPLSITAKAGEYTDVTVNSGAVLNLDNISTFTCGNFTGGGTLVLDTEGLMNINGSVSGVTAFETKGGYAGASGPVMPGHTYISGPSVTASAFTFNSNVAQSGYTPACENGNWYIINPDEGEKLNIDSFDFTPAKVDCDADFYLFVPAVLTGVDDGVNASDFDLTYTVKHGGREYTSVPSEDYYGCAIIEELGLETFIFSESDAENGSLDATVEFDFYDTFDFSGKYEITASYESPKGTVSDTVILDFGGEPEFSGIISFIPDSETIRKGNYCVWTVETSTDVTALKLTADYTLSDGRAKTISLIFTEASSSQNLTVKDEGGVRVWTIRQRFTYSGTDAIVKLSLTLSYRLSGNINWLVYNENPVCITVVSNLDLLNSQNETYAPYTLIDAVCTKPASKGERAAITIKTTDDCTKVRIGYMAPDGVMKYTTYQTTTASNVTYTDSNGVRTWVVNYKVTTDATEYTVNARGTAWSSGKAVSF